MAEKLQIKASIDTTMLERGFERVRQGFDSVKGYAKGLDADLHRMGISAKGVSKGLVGMSVAGSAAIIGLASKAPAVAPALAQISVSMDKLARYAGQVLKPEFDKLAGGFDKLVSFSMKHPNIFKGLVLSTTAVAGIRAVTALFGIKITPALLTALGYLAAIGVTGYAGAKGAEKAMDVANEWLGLNDTPVNQTQMGAGGYSVLLQDKLVSEISGRPSRSETIREKDKIIEQGFNATPGGTISPLSEEDRKYTLGLIWDRLWS